MDGSNMKAYDLVVIGGGPAGVSGARTAAAHQKSVALVNSDEKLGGAGINTGTLPSKTLRETALALSGIQTRKLHVDFSLRHEATVADFLRHEQKVKVLFNTTLRRWTDALNIDFYFGAGSFRDPHTVCVSNSSNGQMELRGDKVLIATGSSPLRPSIFPFSCPHVYDSDTILKLDRLPKTLAVVGAGVVGTEYACTFAALGVQVHLIDSRDVMLPFLDSEVSQTLGEAMEHNGIVLHKCERVLQCEANNEDRIVLTLASGGDLAVEAVLVAAGRRSNSMQLNLPAAGITAGDHGLVQVDEFYRTTTANIYGAGDVIGFPALASTSLEQGRRAIGHAFNLKVRSGPPKLLPTGIYTIPEVSMVGETETSLRERRVDYVVGRASYESNVRGQIIGDAGFLKLLFRRSDMKLLGVHILGEYATELVHIGMIAMMVDATTDLFDEACFNLPSLTELYKEAAHDASLQSA